MRGRKHSASKESRRQRVIERRDRRRQDLARQREAEAREAAMRAALARAPESPAQQADRLLADQSDSPRAAQLRALLALVAERAPRLIDTDWLQALRLVADADWVRPLAAWKASGKSRQSLFRSLGEHVLARYPMPPFLWTAFVAEEHAAALSPVAVHVAAGGSLYQAVKSGLMPVPLTRATCHALMQHRGEGAFLEAVRRVQVQAAGGDRRLYRAWYATRAGRRLHARADEEFWQTVIAWLAANPMLPTAEVSPLVDYIERRRAEEPGFSMKGRSALALLRAMREWHRELTRSQGHVHRSFAPSGLEAMQVDRSRRNREGRLTVEVWRFREVLDTDTLLDEGRAMGHCVYSYAPWIDKGQCSIWTLTLRDNIGHWRMLTLEVRGRAIVQARGRFNRLPEPRERIVMDEWAVKNGLKLSIGA